MALKVDKSGQELGLHETQTSTIKAMNKRCDLRTYKRETSLMWSAWDQLNLASLERWLHYRKPYIQSVYNLCCDIRDLIQS